MSLRPTLAFLEALSANNTKEWFDDNRGQYEQARAAFEQFIGELLGQFHRIDDIGPLEPREVVHRINRDVRFSVVERVLAVCEAARPLTLYFDQLLGPRAAPAR